MRSHRNLKTFKTPRMTMSMKLNGVLQTYILLIMIGIEISNHCYWKVGDSLLIMQRRNSYMRAYLTTKFDGGLFLLWPYRNAYYLS